MAQNLSTYFTNLKNIVTIIKADDRYIDSLRLREILKLFVRACDLGLQIEKVSFLSARTQQKLVEAEINKVKKAIGIINIVGSTYYKLDNCILIRFCELYYAELNKLFTDVYKYCGLKATPKKEKQEIKTSLDLLDRSITYWKKQLAKPSASNLEEKSVPHVQTLALIEDKSVAQLDQPAPLPSPIINKSAFHIASENFDLTINIQSIIFDQSNKHHKKRLYCLYISLCTKKSTAAMLIIVEQQMNLKNNDSPRCFVSRLIHRIGWIFYSQHQLEKKSWSEQGGDDKYMNKLEKLSKTLTT